MVGDIRRGIHQARANYLVALGVLTYIEVLGGLISGDGGLPRRSRSNFNVALNELPPKYSAFRMKVLAPGAAAPTAGVYEVLRCGMVHQYTPTGVFIVYNNPGRRAVRGRLGFELEQLPNGSHRLAVNNNELFRDLKGLLAKVGGWIATLDPVHYPNVKKALERIHGYQVVP
jgi:hypothetical protein